MLKRIAYILLSAIMAVSLCVPALAAEAGGGWVDSDRPYIDRGIDTLKDTGEAAADKSPDTTQDESNQGSGTGTPAMKNPIVRVWVIIAICFIFIWPVGLIVACVFLYMAIRNLLIDVKSQEAMKKELDVVRTSNEILLHLIQDEHREKRDC